MNRHVKSILSLVLLLCILSGCAETKPYDALTDPNVLWGEEVSYDLPDYIPHGSVILGPRLGKAVKSAGEENLIAFKVRVNYCHEWPTDITRLAIPDELVDDPILTAKIEAYNQSPQTKLFMEIYLYVGEAAPSVGYREFFQSWKRIEAEGLRDRFIELGFIPVYDLEHLPPCETIVKETELVLTFVGSADAILQLEEKLSEEDQYYILDFAAKEVAEASE